MCHSLRRGSAAWLLGVLVLAAGAPSSEAQVLYGSIVGAVHDSSAAAVPGATITATHRETNLVLTAVSNDAGTYTIVNALPGSYDVRIQLQGFRPFEKTGVPVSANT
ncbi:MAG: carboxypeptidase-like regulatory domain-containing protein, partial [Vicinamibacteraceae bacterium]